MVIAPWRVAEAWRLLRLRILLPAAFGEQGMRELLQGIDAASGARRRSAPGHAARGSLDELERLVQRVFRPLPRWRPTCLWRALAGYATLRAAGADVRLVLGVRGRGAGDLDAHAWLERGGRGSIGAPAPAAGYHVAFRWPDDRAAARRGGAHVPGLRWSEDAVLTELRDGTGVLLDLRSRFYFTLNRTGVLVWKLLGEEARDVAAVAAAVASRFPEAEPAAVRRDVEALVAELKAEGLLVDAG